MVDASDAEVVRRAIAGDPAAQAQLWERHHRLVAAVLLAHSPLNRGRRADLDDLMQEVALTLCARISTLEQPERFAGWLVAVARTAAKQAHRKERSRIAPQPLDHEPVSPAPSRSDGDLLDVARTLPIAYREPLLLQAVQGLSQREIAAALDLPETTVETRLVRGRRLLREAAERAAAASRHEVRHER